MTSVVKEVTFLPHCKTNMARGRDDVLMATERIVNEHDWSRLELTRANCRLLKLLLVSWSARSHSMKQSRVTYVEGLDFVQMECFPTEVTIKIFRKRHTSFWHLLGFLWVLFCVFGLFNFGGRDFHRRIWILRSVARKKKKDIEVKSRSKIGKQTLQELEVNIWLWLRPLKHFNQSAKMHQLWFWWHNMMSSFFMNLTFCIGRVYNILKSQYSEKHSDVTNNITMTAADLTFTTDLNNRLLVVLNVIHHNINILTRNYAKVHCGFNDATWVISDILYCDVYNIHDLSNTVTIIEMWQTRQRPRKNLFLLSLKVLSIL